MSFKDFLAVIKSPKLQRIAMYWEAARHKKPMPGRGDINPVAIGPDLAIAWSWKYDRDTDSFTGQLVGEAIKEFFGESYFGMRMKNFFPPNRYPTVFAQHKRVVVESAFAHSHGRVFILSHKYGKGERITMPLAGDGVHGDGIFGATAYEMEQIYRGAAGPRYIDAEQADLYSLS